MSKFKVGDRIEPIAADAEYVNGYWSKHFAKEYGPVIDYFVRRATTDQVGVSNKNSGGAVVYWNASRFAPAYSSCAAAEVDNLAAEYGAPKSSFKAGDRVRYSGQRETSFDKTMVGKLGTVTKDDGGVCVGVDWDGSPVWSYGVYRENIERTAVAPVPTLQIEAGKFYRTRDGRKALVSNNASGDLDRYPFYHEVDGRGWHAITREGKSCINYDHSDLIAERVDERADAGGGFKAGDRIRLVRNPAGESKIGDEYVAVGRAASSIGASMSVHFTDKRGEISWRPGSYFELVTAPTTTTKPANKAIVALIEYGQPKPSARPHVHDNVDLAIKEAERLADKHRGQEFGVYDLVTTRKEAQIIYPFAWQNKAVQGRLIAAIKQLRADTGLGLKTAKDAVEAWLVAVAA